MLLSEQARSRCDFSTPIHDQYLIYTDKVLDAFTETTCQQACTQERDFNCRSYSFLGEVSYHLISEKKSATESCPHS